MSSPTSVRTHTSKCTSEWHRAGRYAQQRHDNMGHLNVALPQVEPLHEEPQQVYTVFPFLSDFERLRLVEERSYELGLGLACRLPRESCDLSNIIEGDVDMAARELDAGLLDDYSLIRPIPNGCDGIMTNTRVTVKDLMLKYTYS